MRRVCFILLFSLASCGYHFYETSPQPKTITVPYVSGDPKGLLVDALCRSLAASGDFCPVLTGGDLKLCLSIVSEETNWIGYRYDREPVSGVLEQNLLPTEGRKAICATVSLIDERTGEMLIGPHLVRANAEFDFIEPNSLRDVSFIDCCGKRETVMQFSLGQLDSAPAGLTNSLVPLYRELADRVVDELSTAYILKQ